MTKEEERANLTRFQEQFLVDLANMLVRYENKELALMTRINPANLSRYKTHPPGIIAMKKFYRGLAGIINNPFEQTNLNMEDNKDQKDNKESQDQQQESKKREGSNKREPIEYGHEPDPDTTQNQKSDEAGIIRMYQHEDSRSASEIIADLLSENQHHRNLENKMMDNIGKIYALPDKIINSFDQMVAVHATAIEKDLLNSKTHGKMVELLIKKFGGEE